MTQTELIDRLESGDLSTTLKDLNVQDALRRYIQDADPDILDFFHEYDIANKIVSKITGIPVTVLEEDQIKKLRNPCHGELRLLRAVFGQGDPAESRRELPHMLRIGSNMEPAHILDGLVILWDGQRGYNIAHIASGTKLNAQPFRPASRARTALRKLVKIADWTQPTRWQVLEASGITYRDLIKRISDICVSGVPDPTKWKRLRRAVEIEGNIVWRFYEGDTP